MFAAKPVGSVVPVETRTKSPVTKPCDELVILPVVALRLAPEAITTAVGTVTITSVSSDGDAVYVSTTPPIDTALVATTETPVIVTAAATGAELPVWTVNEPLSSPEARRVKTEKSSVLISRKQ